MIHTGDCIAVMAGMPAASVDAVVTDPPYGLEFMGKEWDSPARYWDSRDGSEGAVGQWDDGKKSGGYRALLRSGVPAKMVAGHSFQAWCEAWGREALRVTKPGGYLLAFGGTRTHHRLVCGLEDAGWIIRDELDWIYASGFPKGKANLKPAHEPIVLARKPGPLRPLAIDACRVEPVPGDYDHPGNDNLTAGESFGEGGTHRNKGQQVPPSLVGRWPSNVLLQDPALFDEPNPEVVGSGATANTGGAVSGGEHAPSGYPSFRTYRYEFDGYGDTGGYSRFFIIPKADRADREPVLRGQLEEREAYTHNSDGRDMKRPGNAMGGGERARVERGEPAYRPRVNTHATVKPVDLMRHLVRLVTPPGGTVLDPFLGSGSTAIACEMEGFAWVAIEKEAEYVKIAEARLNGVQKGMGLSA